MPKQFEKKALRNIAINSRCQAFSINSYSDTLSDISSMSSISAPDKYNQKIKSSKNSIIIIIHYAPTSTQKKVPSQISIHLTARSPAITS